jgi:hypothetical protein
MRYEAGLGNLATEQFGVGNKSKRTEDEVSIGNETRPGM